MIHNSLWNISIIFKNSVIKYIYIYIDIFGWGKYHKDKWSEFPLLMNRLRLSTLSQKINYCKIIILKIRLVINL